jgi:type I restriction enzyme S subunit
MKETAVKNTQATGGVEVKRYKSYKDSGVEWLGEIPAHWVTKKFKFVLDQSKGLTITKQNLINEGVFCVNYGEIHSKFGFELDTTKHKLKCVGEEYLITDSNSLLNTGDFVFADTSEDIEGSGNFTHLRSSDKTFAGYHTVIARPKIKIESLFLAFVFDSTSFRNQIRKKVKGVKVYSITQSVLKETNVWIPPLQEQTKIAQFLDDKTTKIDEAIAIKEQQIQLLKERKQILIHKAVTQGLNPNVTLKDSGVKWIGEIPEGWEVKKLKYILNEKLKYGANESGIDYDIDLPRYVRITDFGNDGKLSEKNKLSLSWKNGGDYLLKDGDILFARSGATVGKTYQFKKSMSVEDNYCFAGYLIKAEANEEIILSDFLYLFTNSELFNKWKDSIFIKATIENIGADKYSQLNVIVPPVNEQKEILTKYSDDNKKIETAIGLKQQEIEKLKEYKSSLINGVVTGKVKVC